MVLAKKFRLYGKEDFRRMYRGPFRRASWKYGSVVYVKNNIFHSRFAFVVSSRVSKKSTVRNLLKRRTSEWLRNNFRRVVAGYDVVFIFSKSATAARPAGFVEDLERLLISIHVLI